MNTKNADGRQRFNIADAVIIVVILMVIAGIALRMYHIFSAEEDMQSVTVEFEISNITSEHIDLERGKALYLVSDDTKAGYILDFTVSDMTEYAYNENGEPVKAVVPGKSTVKGTMILDGKITENGFYLDGRILLTEAQEISLYTAKRESVFKIIKIYE